jgi:hypothetical protein
MPYIDTDARRNYDQEVDQLVDALKANDNHPGHLSYILTTLLLKTGPNRYADYSQLVGVLETTKLEFVRRYVSNYEDRMLGTNGDVDGSHS